MRRRISSLTDPGFQAEFGGLTRSWFRLETLQAYVAPGEIGPLAAFQAGEPVPFDAADEAWSAMIAGHVSSGRTLRRVHVIEEPLSPYVRFELAVAYTAGLAGGEDIRVVPVRRGQWPTGVPREDFWLFDAARVWRMFYDVDGRPLGAELDDDPAVVARYLQWQDAALALSVPVTDYITGIPLRRVS